MRKAWIVILTISLYPFSAMAGPIETPADKVVPSTKANAGEVAPDIESRLREELRVKPVRELQPEELKQLARAGLEAKPHLQSSPRVHQLSGKHWGGIIFVGAGIGLVAGGVVRQRGRDEPEPTGVVLLYAGLGAICLGVYLLSR